MTKRRSLLSALYLPLIAALCLGSLILFSILYDLPQRAERSFGPPDPGLAFPQQIYLSGLLLLQANELTVPHDSLGKERPFQVKLGESASSVISRLRSEGLVANANTFRTYLRYTGLDTSLQAGNYTLSPAMTSIEIAHALQDATPTSVTFNILAGWRIEELAAALPTSGLKFTPEEFIAKANNHTVNYSFIDLPLQASLEGFLYPDTYRLSRDLTVGEFIAILLENFEMHLTPDLRQGFKEQGLTIFEAVSLASMVQREAIVVEEMPEIASVFLNRLAAGIKLDSDPTVQYALDYNTTQNTWWTNPLSLDDLQIDSQYNTYRYPGFPPGPISNPGLSALQAVAFPGETPYYYFRASCDGSGHHFFAETYEQHVNNACP